MIEFIWDATDKWRLNENEAELSLNSTDSIQEIESLPPSQASRILGAWTAPNRYSIDQTKRLLSIITSWAYIFRSGHIRKS